MNPSSCNVLVYGGGAVGAIFGWRIAQQSHARVSVVCRSNWNVVSNHGYYLRTSTWGNGRFKPRQVFQAGAIAKLIDKHRFDYIVCSNKVTDGYASALQDLHPLVRPDTTLVSAQNGMDVEVPLRKAFPNNTVLSAICNIGCGQVRPGYIEQNAAIKRPAFLIGVHSPSSGGHRVDASRRDALAAMDSKFATTQCINGERWRKLIFNSAWNGTCAITGLNTRQLLEYPGAAEVVIQLADEAYKVGVASGIDLDPRLPMKTIELAQDSAPITPSTLQDARARRPMELSPIFGYLVEQAAKVGTHVPYLTWIYTLLRLRNSAYVAEQAVVEPLHRSFAAVEELSSTIVSSGMSAEVM
ncbi:Oxidoreductase AFT12-1 [Pseudocercospora fuligena]|uniref:Oxidoreductase AFT12-1 n=1 Tax=Pseudocercospora fuligena TaxID=685502 RepID=A0A8H6RCD4_9PEZI|nr:Oxidoreductase AFT12-1 [Pseudocercospora fuligena]